MRLMHFVAWSLCSGVRRDSLQYVGFPGLSLTPIPESPLQDSALKSRLDDERDTHLEMETTTLVSERQTLGSVKHPSANAQPSTKCSVNVHVVQTTYLPKGPPMSSLARRTYTCKLLLFALFGFVFVAGIILWVLSPTFTS